MMDFIDWIGQTGLSTWLAESPSLFAYPIVLILHSVGMGIIVGLSVAVSLCILGAAGPIPLVPMQKLFPLMMLGFWVNAATGVLLLIATPVFFVNWDFYVKLTFIALAVWTLRSLRKQVFDDPSLDKRPLAMRDKLLAGATIFFWAGAITAGRMTAYLGYPN